MNQQPFLLQILLRDCQCFWTTSKGFDVRTKQNKLELGKPSSWPGASGDPGRHVANVSRELFDNVEDRKSRISWRDVL